MTPVKTCFLLLLSVLFIAPTVSEVVMSMSDCEGFLLNNKPPQVPHVVENGKIQDNNRYKVICQTYNNVRRFVTLYDTKNRIPVFSAYKFTGAETGRPNKRWKIEPQLENMNDDKNMRNRRNQEYKNQATDTDYSTSTYMYLYNRGHLFPSSYAKTLVDKETTFTLTNAVPQVPSFNQGSWNKMETSVKCVMEMFCINNNDVIEAYVITGAKPSDKTINNRVNVPSLLWSAFCCYSKNLNQWMAGAYWGDNVPNRPGSLKLVTLKQLHDQLKKGNKPFQAFSEPNCPLDQILSDSDPQMNQKRPRRAR